METTELQLLCREWQERLGLQDWRIHIEILRERDFSKSNRGAEINIVLSNKSANIHMLDPVDYIDCWFEQDQEKDLVHELGHIIFDPFYQTEDGLVKTFQEQAIDTFAKALVNLKREGERMKES